MEQPQDDKQPNKNHGVYFVPGLHRGLVALETVASAQRPVSVSDIAAELGITRSSAFRLVYTLVYMGFLAESGKSKHYELGPRVLNIGFAFLASQNIIEIAKPELERLRDETLVTAHLAIRDERNVLYLSCVQTRSGFLSNMNVGSRVPAYASPMGWYLLSDLSNRDLAKLTGSGAFKPLTSQTPANLAELAATIGKIAHQPCYVSHGVLEAGGASVSAPVLDHSGKVVAAIDISGPNSAFDLDQLETRYADAVVGAARRISAKLGYARAPEPQDR
jgi:IclR family pca regulon transcriptional regulator